MDVRFPGFVDNIFLDNIQDMLDQFTDEVSDTKQQPNNPSRVYVRDTKAMARTPADIKDLPNAYQYIVDMPGVKPSEVTVQLEDDNVLVVSGERRRDKEKDEKEGVKYVKMERRIGKFMRKFELPENANLEKISAVCQDGVLTVTVEKVPPPKPKVPKTIEVKGA
ncbi:17.6 kDa class II heat shock protein-like [Chenopodium quinoa]|uniref:17.6 kDa class II heat shock protein-like n=1 Tax=Chenopodium quinoa TaxID=63459 RepID=UPI000B78FC08|nr:17.6 kDa class II heat shock protein-like [Chenopodium quinoa]